MRGLVFLLCALLFLGAAAAADEAPTAADLTEPGRSLARALEVCLTGSGAAEGKRSVLFLVDAAPALQAAGFAPAFAAALERTSAALGRTQIGLAVCGAKKGLHLDFTQDRAALAAALAALLATPTASYQDVHADVRRAAGLLASRSGSRELVLVTLENGDVESNLDAAAAALRRAHVRLSVITQEAFLADSFGVSGGRQAPSGLQFGSGDGAFLALPWGWLFQMAVANEITPSGFGPYALGHLAAQSGGRVFLHAAPSSLHTCSVYGACLFCNADHRPPDEAFQTQRLRALAPSLAPRKDVAGAMARDAYVRMLLKAWGAASKEGLLRSRPALRLAAGGVRPERRHDGRWDPVMGGGLGFPRMANRAEKLQQVCERQIAWLGAELAGTDPGSGSERHRAMAELTLAMLHLTRTNLVGYAAWCREVAPVLLEREPEAFAPPEVSPLSDDRRPMGVGYSNMCLCHGVEPFLEVRMPGGAAYEQALRRYGEVHAAFMRRWAHTPFALALKRQGLARFHFTYPGRVTPLPDPPRTGSDAEKPTTENARPSRAGSPSAGGGSGAPTTGGG